VGAIAHHLTTAAGPPTDDAALRLAGFTASSAALASARSPAATEIHGSPCVLHHRPPDALTHLRAPLSFALNSGGNNGAAIAVALPKRAGS
jgi:hypothetical protein